VNSVSIWEMRSPPTIAIPNGRRSSAPMPRPNASGKAPSNAVIVVIMMGRKTKDARLGRWRRAGEILVALHLDGEVDHHDGILFTMPMRRDDPDDRDHAQFGLEREKREQRTDAGRGQCREIVIGWTKLS